MSSQDGEEKHFKVVYGKVLGIPVWSATPITDEGHRIFNKYSIPIFVLIGASVFGSRFIEDDLMKGLIFIVGWTSSVLIGFLLWRQIRKSAEFEREYFFKKNRPNNSK